MLENTKYYHINEDSSFLIIDDRVDINWFEIFVYPSAIFLFLFFGSGKLLIAIPVTLFTLIGYVIFRYFAWSYYTEFIINKGNREVFLVKKRMDKELSTELITNNFDFKKVAFKKVRRSGMIRFSLQYKSKTIKTHNIMILKTEEDKERILQILKRM